jgi:predicted pyridoxine 5'-phosphate oxidase superfamily flavin-nucleotide-binding protein
MHVEAHSSLKLGFLKVLNERTIAYADFRGNRQYLSSGNLAADDRISLILMDYAHGRRLKIWGRAKLIDISADPSLLARMLFLKPSGRVVGLRTQSEDSSKSEACKVS